MQITGEEEDGRIIIYYDSRWMYPELLGYAATDIQYRMLQELWEKITGKKVNPQTKKEDG